MDLLATHIIGLLKVNSQVYLPGLGTFKKERIPASFDKKTNSFLAPTQRIVFNIEDGAIAPLINSISKTENITAEESENQLNKLIDSILLELNETGQYTIPHLGKLVKQEGDISFIEDEENEDLPFYKDVNEIKLIELSKEEPVLELEKKDEEETEETSLPVQEFEPKGRPINWLWPVIIIIVIVIAGGLWFLNPQKWENKEIPAVVESNIDIVIPDTDTSLNPETQEIVGQDSSSTLSQESTQPIVEEVPVQPQTSYEIIIVSFGKLADAEKYVENMNAKGYKIRILENKSPGNLYKVSYGSFIDETEAQLELNKVRETLSKEAWIYKNKK
jgi:nucleoid DNA-binding protein